MSVNKTSLKRKKEIIDLIQEASLSDSEKTRLITIVESINLPSGTLPTGVGGAIYVAGQTDMRDASAREMAIQRELSILYDKLRFSRNPRETALLNKRIRSLEEELGKTQKSFRRSERLKTLGAVGAGIGASAMAYNSYKKNKEEKRQREIEQFGLQGFEDVY